MDKESECVLRRYHWYLVFMLVACGGAGIWQFFLPALAGDYSFWGVATGWQREIALWNVALIIAIVLALKNNDLAPMKLLTVQSTILCWVLGIHHLVTWLNVGFSMHSMIHFLGIFEVMLLGGIWGLVVLIKDARR